MHKGLIWRFGPWDSIAPYSLGITREMALQAQIWSAPAALSSFSSLA